MDRRRVDPLRFFYFDLGNVLLFFDHEIACRQLGQLVGLPASRVRDLLFASGLQQRHERGDISSREFYDAFCSAANARPDYHAFNLAGSQMFELNVPVIPIVAHLRAAGYLLGILSNTSEAHWQYISSGRYTVINAFFDVRVLSFEQRSVKPERPIYEEAIRRAGVKPHEIFFTDDKLENVEGASEAGLDAVLFSSPRQLATELWRRGVTFNY